MKSLSSKLMALVLALSMLMGTVVVASAASSTDYSVKVEDNKVSFIQNGKTIGTYNSKDAKLKLVTDKDGDLLVCFYDANNNYKRITLGKQTSLSLSGSMTSLTLDKSLSDSLSFSVSASVGTMSVASKNSVKISGKVDKLTITGAAKVTVTKDGKVTSASVAKSATLTNELDQDRLGQCEELLEQERHPDPQTGRQRR